MKIPNKKNLEIIQFITTLPNGNQVQLAKLKAKQDIHW